jgi:RecB family exonuclease
VTAAGTITDVPDPVLEDPVLGELASCVVGACRRRAGRPVTVVVPTPWAAVAARRDLARLCPEVAIDVLSAEELVRRLAAPGLAVKARHEAPVAARDEAIRAEALLAGSRLAAVVDRRGGPAAVRRALDELGACTPAGRAAVRRAGAGDTAATVVDLLDPVRARLHGAGLADVADLHQAAADAPASAVTALGAVVAFGCSSWPGPSSTARPPLGRLLHRVAAGTDLFTVADARSQPVTDVRPCADPDEEVRVAVRSALEALDAGVPVHRVAVLHPAGAAYARMAHQYLVGSGVPVDGPGFRTLDRTAAGRCLLGALELAVVDWRRDAVVTWLATAPVCDGPESGPVPARRWDRLSAAAGVVRGPGQWHDRLGAVADSSSDGEDARWLADFMAGLVRRTGPDPAPGARRWSARAARARAVLDHYLPDTAPSGSGRGARWPDDERAARAQVRAVVAELSHADGVEAAPPDDARFRAALRARLEETPLVTAPSHPGGGAENDGTGGGGPTPGILVAPVGAEAGMRLHTVAVVGLSDDLVPAQPTEDPLLPEAVRGLPAQGGLTTRAERARRERRQLGAALAAGTERRVATFAVRDPRSRSPRRPSRWLDGAVTSGARWHPLASFAGDVADGARPVTAVEPALHALHRAVARGGDAAWSPVFTGSARALAGLAMWRARLDPSFTRFDGHVGVGLVTAFDPTRPVSATRLETYAECPRRFLFARELQAQRRTRPEDLWSIEPAERGTLVHAILEQYVLERLEGAPASSTRLQDIASARFAAAEAEGRVGRPLPWRLEQQRIRRDLARFHAEEGDLEPLAAELAFGEADGAPAVTVVLDDGRQVSFRGRADRVDRSPGGQLVVSDYKTGRQPDLGRLIGDPVVQGRRLQLPLYALAARQRFGAGGDTHARYWLLSSERSASCYHLRVTAAVEDRFRRVIGLIADGIEAGVFPAIPGRPVDGGFAGCRWCDYDAICPVTRDRQWQAKRDAARLRPVVELIDNEAPAHLHGAVVRGFVDVEERS